MTTPSHATPGAADPCRPPAPAILQDSARHYIGEAVNDAAEAARRLRWLAHGERLEHGLEAQDCWLTAAQCERLQRLAAVAELVAADARVLLVEVGELVI